MLLTLLLSNCDAFFHLISLCLAYNGRGFRGFSFKCLLLHLNHKRVTCFSSVTKISWVPSLLCCRHRVSLFSHWKQRGMYATCMWVVQLLLVISKIDSLFIYVPEFYIEVLVSCFFLCARNKNFMNGYFFSNGPHYGQWLTSEWFVFSFFGGFTLPIKIYPLATSESTISLHIMIKEWLKKWETQQ